jgi:hypothetical protein
MTKASPSPPTLVRVMEAVSKLEEQFPVDRWSVDGLRVWPILRTGLGLDPHLWGQSPPAPTSRTTRAGRGLVGYAWTRITDSAGTAQLEPADAVFFAQAVDRTLVGTKWHEVYSDPIVAALAAHGRRCLVLELSDQGRYRIPRARPTVLIAPRLLVGRLRARLPGPAPRFELDGYENLEPFLAEMGIDHAFPSRRELARQARYVSAVARELARVLARTRPRFGFLTCYYSLLGMAFVLACRETGVTPVDVQHGAAGELHHAYGRWTRVPREGYELLPRVFWCWSQGDADAIDRWSRPLFPEHRTFTGGNLWLETWRRGDSELVQSCEKALEEKVPRGRPEVLLSLQPFDDSLEGRFLAAIRATGDRFRWWVRLHPVQTLEDRAAIRALLAREGIANAEVDLATESPLPLLLRRASAHVTRLSAVVRSAAELGVPSIATDPQALELYAREVASGLLVRAGTPDEIVAALDRLVAARRPADAAAGPPPADVVERFFASDL